MNAAERIEAIADFLGSKMTEEDAIRLFDEARATCSISELEWLYSVLDEAPFYTLISEHNAEMGGYSRY